MSQPRRQLAPQPRLPFGIKLLVAFFAFGMLACAITIAALLFPTSALDSVWRLNPQAKTGFEKMRRPIAILLMAGVGAACACAAWGLARQRNWGRRLAAGILLVNLLGNSMNAFVFHNPRTLIGLPIGAALIVYLLRHR